MLSSGTNKVQSLLGIPLNTFSEGADGGVVFREVNDKIP